MATFTAAGVKSAAMKSPLPVLVLVLAALAPPSALAWSRQGHQLVGELAQRELSPAAQQEVARLLAGEPEPTLAGVATWADQIRAESRKGHHPLGERSSRWHYVNFQRANGCDYVPARDCPGGNCIIAAINTQRDILADPTRPLAERRDALKFLVHFVGDAHQPMHAGYADDRGGNNFQIQYRGEGAPEGQGTQLHGVWDYWVLQSAGLDNDQYVERLLTLPVPADPAAAADNAPAEWTLESCRLIRDEALYPSKRKRVLGDDYLDRHRPLAERRLRQAGARLAALLNAALAPGR
jgi:hypothetical protein